MGRHLGEFEQLVLFAVLALGEDAYGASIQERIEGETGRDRSTGSIYTALDRMESRGYVRSWLGEPTPKRGGRRKRHYEVTPEGARALEAAYEQLQSMAQGNLGRLRELAGG